MLLVYSNSLNIILYPFFVLLLISVCFSNIAESWSYIYTIFSLHSLHNLDESLEILQGLTIITFSTVNETNVV